MYIAGLNIPSRGGFVYSSADADSSRMEDLPHPVVVALLEREVLFTRAKLHGLWFDQVQCREKLRNIKRQSYQVKDIFLAGA